LIYGPDERLRATIGENEPMKPTGVAVTTNRIHVADLDGHCIRVYAKETRQLLFTIPRQPAANQPGRLFMPVNLAIDKHGNVYVSDLAACQVQVFDAEGKHLRTIGSRGDMPGQFARPKGIAVDRAERVYVVDAATQVCQVFDDIGRLLLYFGEPGGSPAPLNLPAGVAIDYDHVPLFQKYVAPGFVVENLVIITNQYGDRKVSVYGLGHKQ
jgi:DNA-binding beta-propeller fold protein YncE